MEQQVRDFIPHLHPGMSYLFEHTRKGPFVGVFQGTRPTKEGDPADEMFLEIDVLTEDGSGQERLANAFVYNEGRKMRPALSYKLIRPSLLKSISAPSKLGREQMLAQFTKIKEDAERQASINGSEPLYPISLPTAKALDKLAGSEEVSTQNKPGFFKRLFGVK